MCAWINFNAETEAGDESQAAKQGAPFKLDLVRNGWTTELVVRLVPGSGA